MNKRTGWISAVALVAWITTAPAFARPPTVGVNPGYDRRLVESRKQQASVTPDTPVRHRGHHRHRY